MAKLASALVHRAGRSALEAGAETLVIVADPTYLTTPFVVSNQFKREPDDSKWSPSPCSTDAPLGTFHPPAF